MSKATATANQNIGAATNNLVASIWRNAHNTSGVTMDYNIYFETVGKIDGELVSVSKKMEHVDNATYCAKTTELMNRPAKDNFTKSYSQVVNETGGFDFHLEYVPKN